MPTVRDVEETELLTAALSSEGLMAGLTILVGYSPLLVGFADIANAKKLLINSTRDEWFALGLAASVLGQPPKENLYEHATVVSGSGYQGVENAKVLGGAEGYRFGQKLPSDVRKALADYGWRVAREDGHLYGSIQEMAKTGRGEYGARDLARALQPLIEEWVEHDHELEEQRRQRRVEEVKRQIEDEAGKGAGSRSHAEADDPDAGP